MKNIVVINGHPSKDSFCAAIASAYIDGASETGNKIEVINISELNFNPILENGYQKRTELEPDLLVAWEKIKGANHIVIVMPVWWGGMPAGLKGFFDRLFLPGMAFQYKENSVWWDKLLVGKTAHIIATMDTPTWYYKIFYKNAGISQLKRNILQFCGIKPVKTTMISPIKNSTDEFRLKWLKRISTFANNQS